MDKKNNAIFSVKVNGKCEKGLRGETHIEGNGNDILNALRVGLQQLHESGVSKKTLLEVVEDACSEIKEEKQFEEDLADAPKEIRDAVTLLKSLGLI